MGLTNWGGMTIGQDAYRDHAANLARGQFDAGMGATLRQAGRMGINPNSGAFLNMLNNAQYVRSAGINAAVNDANYKWLGAAQDQYNRDRAFAASEDARRDANARAWAGIRNANKKLDMLEDQTDFQNKLLNIKYGLKEHKNTYSSPLGGYAKNDDIWNPDARKSWKESRYGNLYDMALHYA